MNARVLTFLLLLALPLAAGAEGYLYVLSAKAKLYTEPSFRSPVVARLSKGEKTEALGKNNYWFKVRYQGKEGWISRLAVSPHPPVKRSSLLASDDGRLERQARRRASVNATTAAVRGLREDERTRMNAVGVPDYAALRQMEAIVVSDAEVAEFTRALQP